MLLGHLLPYLEIYLIIAVMMKCMRLREAPQISTCPLCSNRKARSVKPLLLRVRMIRKRKVHFYVYKNKPAARSKME
jgi:hypothetical protein